MGGGLVAFLVLEHAVCVLVSFALDYFVSSKQFKSRKPLCAWRAYDRPHLALAAKSSSKLQQFDRGTSVCTTSALAGWSFGLPLSFLSDFFLAAIGGATEPANNRTAVSSNF